MKARLGAGRTEALIAGSESLAAIPLEPFPQLVPRPRRLRRPPLGEGEEAVQGAVVPLEPHLAVAPVLDRRAADAQRLGPARLPGLAADESPTHAGQDLAGRRVAH